MTGAGRWLILFAVAALTGFAVSQVVVTIRRRGVVSETASAPTLGDHRAGTGPGSAGAATTRRALQALAAVSDRRTPGLGPLPIDELTQRSIAEPEAGANTRTAISQILTRMPLETCFASAGARPVTLLFKTRVGSTGAALSVAAPELIQPDPTLIDQRDADCVAEVARAFAPTTVRTSRGPFLDNLQATIEVPLVLAARPRRPDAGH